MIEFADITATRHILQLELSDAWETGQTVGRMSELEQLLHLLAKLVAAIDCATDDEIASIASHPLARELMDRLEQMAAGRVREETLQ